MSVVLYYASVSGAMETKKKQQRIEMILDGKKINYTKVDIAASEEDKQKMRDIMGDPKGLPPQLCNGEQYCGGYDAFDNAVEMETLEAFLKL